MHDDFIKRCITAAAAAIHANKERLTALDQAIGDGDHGINMARGMAALQEKSADIAALPFNEACKQAGMTLVMSVGGASGPLFGSCLLGFGGAADDFPASQAQAAALLRGGVEAVKKRGKSDAGAKTMLDVLVPLLRLLEQTPGISPARVRESAAQFARDTEGMVASKGRAAFLGERSAGHVDPGAQSTALLVGAVCDALEAGR